MPDKEIICIVDDDADHCDALGFLLDNEGYEVQTYSSANDFLAVDHLRCDCLILDYKMPGINGMELLELLKIRGFTSPIIFLTAHADLDMAIKIFKDGANDLIQKPADSDKLLKAVGDAIEKFKIVHMHITGESGEAAEKLASLTNRERQVIDLVSMGLMNCQVASRLNLSERTVETHRANAYRKLGISNFAQLRKVLLLSGQV